MFGLINETPWDLRFHIGRIPVRVHPGFWVIGAFMGWSEGWAQALGTNPLAVVFVWLLCIFVSILVHELGHALAAQRCGWPPQIVLYHFGGLAMYRPTWGQTRWKSIWISLAGPGAGFVLFGIVLVIEYALLHGFPGSAPLVQTLNLNRYTLGFLAYALVQLKFINLWWGLVNLLPVLPLDGGRVAEQVWAMISPRSSEDGPIKLGLVVAGVVSAYCFWIGARYPAILFAVLAFMNFQSLPGNRRGPW